MDVIQRRFIRTCPFCRLHARSNMRRGVIDHGEPEETDEVLGCSTALPKAATGPGQERDVM